MRGLHYPLHTNPDFRKVCDNCPHLRPDFLHHEPPNQPRSPVSIQHKNEKTIRIALMMQIMNLKITLNRRSFCPAKILYILNSGSIWKYLSNEFNALIIPVVFLLLRETRISPSTIVVRAQSRSTSNPGYSAKDPLRQIMRKSLGLIPILLA